MKRRIVVNDRMQKGYVHYSGGTGGAPLRARLRAAAMTNEMLTLGVFGGKYMTDCRVEFLTTCFAREALARSARRAPQLLRRERIPVARRVASHRLD